jgi:hypothetical protein
VSWFTVRRGRLEYRGRITRDPFARWCATKEGGTAIARVAKDIRFSIFGRARSARKRMWRALDTASRAGEFRSAVAAEAGHFLKVMADACYAEALPRTNLSLRRLVLVPRAMVVGRARAGAYARLIQAPGMADVDEAVRLFLIDQLVAEMDAAVRRATPVPRRPVVARDGWACVGLRLGTVWLDPIWAGPDGTGHLFMYELPEQLKRREYKALDAAIEQMAGTVSTLSRTARDAVFRAATQRA